MLAQPPRDSAYVGRVAEHADLDGGDVEVRPQRFELREQQIGGQDADRGYGARILRRSYSYNDGVNFTAERWPPWRQGMEYDAGLFFVCYQKDPRTGFMKIFENMAKFDMLNQYATHTGGGLFACPGGVGQGEFIGQGLFEQA